MYVNHNLSKIQDINMPYCRFSKEKDCFAVLKYRLFNHLLIIFSILFHVWNVDKKKFKLTLTD